MPSVFHSYREFRLAENFSGYPQLATIDRNELLVADWSGRVFWVSLVPPKINCEVIVAQLNTLKTKKSDW